MTLELNTEAFSRRVILDSLLVVLWPYIHSQILHLTPVTGTVEFGGLRSPLFISVSSFVISPTPT